VAGMGVTPWPGPGAQAANSKASNNTTIGRGAFLGIAHTSSCQLFCANQQDENPIRMVPSQPYHGLGWKTGQIPWTLWQSAECAALWAGLLLLIKCNLRWKQKKKCLKTNGIHTRFQPETSLLRTRVLLRTKVLMRTAGQQRITRGGRVAPALILRSTWLALAGSRPGLCQSNRKEAVESPSSTSSIVPHD